MAHRNQLVYNVPLSKHVYIACSPTAISNSELRRFRINRVIFVGTEAGACNDLIPSIVLPFSGIISGSTNAPRSQETSYLSTVCKYIKERDPKNPTPRRPRTLIFSERFSSALINLKVFQRLEASCFDCDGLFDAM